MRGKEQAGRGGGRGKVSKAAETEAREMESWSENERVIENHTNFHGSNHTGK